MNLEKLHPPNNPIEFFPWLKRASEEHWETIEINPGIYGFQIQRATKWLPGLSHEEIAEYEKEMGFPFPESYKLYLRHMNGTDLPAINVFSECGEPYRYASAYYAYPRDLAAVRETIKWIHDAFGVTPEFIDEKGIPRIMPIVSHRFLVMDRCTGNPVLSMHGPDSIFYSRSLESFLANDIFQGGRSIAAGESSIEVKFWLDDEAVKL